NALAVRASARRELGNPAAACADFEALLSIRPGDAGAQLDLARARGEAGDLPAAAAAAREFLRRFPTHPERPGAERLLRDLEERLGASRGR
ncbi:MAG: tetratricopeptide repeat protein, partial [Planctomycetales bacterium]|nr:tetratricopeptide repeat protein [Planctomycetales bacterium]